MTMKYIVIRVASGREIPILFPDVLVHSEVAQSIMRGPGFPRTDAEVVGAGFFDFRKLEAFGKSESLNVESRAIDSFIIRTGS